MQDETKTEGAGFRKTLATATEGEAQELTLQLLEALRYATLNDDEKLTEVYDKLAENDESEDGHPMGRAAQHVIATMAGLLLCAGCPLGDLMQIIARAAATGASVTLERPLGVVSGEIGKDGEMNTYVVNANEQQQADAEQADAEN